MSIRVIFSSLAVMILLGACTSRTELASDPKKRLEEYISRSFAIKSVEDRQVLSGYLTGQAKARLSAWSDDQFRQAFIDSKRQYIKHSFSEVKPISSDVVDITYELTYLDQGRGHDAKVTNKKLAEMVLDQGKWVISEVKNIKELVEYRNEMSLP